MSDDAGADVELWPWLQRDGERDEHFRRFLAYKGLGLTRSLRRAAVEFYGDEYTDGQYQTVRKHSAKHDWVSRARSYDLHVEEEARLKAIERRADAMEREYLVGATMVEAAGRKFKTIDPEEMTASDAIRAAEVGSRIERAALGEGETIDIRVGTLPPRQSADLARKIAASEELSKSLLDEFDAEFGDATTPDDRGGAE